MSFPAERAMRPSSRASLTQIMAHTLRMFGQGLKVSEATMALDAGSYHMDDIIAVGN